MSSSTTALVSDSNPPPMSYAEWKRETTISQVFFRLQLPYRPPQSAIGQFLWRRRLWLEVTFALSMMEPWEKAVVLIFLYLTLGLLAMGTLLYLPQRLVFLNARTAYYLFGRDASAAGAGVDFAESLGRIKALASWGFDSSLASIANVGSYGASLAKWGTNVAAEL